MRTYSFAAMDTSVLPHLGVLTRRGLVSKCSATPAQIAATAATPLRHPRNCGRSSDRGVATPWSATGGGVASAPLREGGGDGVLKGGWGLKGNGGAMILGMELHSGPGQLNGYVTGHFRSGGWLGESSKIKSFFYSSKHILNPSIVRNNR